MKNSKQSTYYFMRAIMISSLLISVNACSLKISVQGIVICETLSKNQSYSKNIKLQGLIKRVLEKDSSALVELINFDCGGGAGCYDLGYIITQIIYQISEEDFIVMMSALSSVDKSRLQELILAGLEYGDNNYDGKMDNIPLETALPSVNQYLSAD